jgi:hypothetical protein
MVLPGIVGTPEWNKTFGGYMTRPPARVKPCPSAIGGGKNSHRVHNFRVIVYCDAIKSV